MQIANCKLQIGTLLVAWLASTVVAARGDVLELTGGGRLEGRLVESEGSDASVHVVELAGGGRVTIPRSQVARVNSTSELDAEYQELARSSPDTVEAHWKLVEWCRERKRRALSHEHLARILELEPNDAEARAALGFRQQDGQWMTRDGVLESRGLVRYEGRYVTPQHVELMERRKETRSSQADWASKLGLLRRWLVGRRQDRTAEARAEIHTIRDPQAADAVVSLIRREKDPDLKRLWIETAARLDHPRAIDALVNLSLHDPDPEIRHDCLEYLVKSGRPGLLTPYIRALKNADNEIVNRAGAALGLIGDEAATGALIDALVTKHTFKVSDANPDQHSYAFSPDSGTFSFGGGGPQSVTRQMHNPAVLSALVTLSGGASFDYDQAQWRRWLAAQAKQRAFDIRRDQ